MTHRSGSFSHDGESSDDLDWELAARVVSGDATPDDEATLATWAGTDHQRVELVGSLRRVWDASPAAALYADAPSIDVGANWARTVERMHAEAPGQTVPRTRNAVRAPALHRSGSSTQRWLAAAGLCAAVGLGAGVYLRLHGTSTAPLVAAVEWQEYTTPRAQRADVHLRDGTHVILGAESSLRVPSNFSTAAARDVELVGTAYFDVVHDTTHPFRVHTRNGIAEDVGTTFVVTAYPETRGTEIVVATGAVKVRGTTLSPGDLARMQTNGDVMVSHGVDVSARLAWTSGHLAFQHAPLAEVLPQVARWYDVDVRLGDAALGKQTFTGTMTTTSAREALDLLAAAAGGRITRRNGAYVLITSSVGGR